MFDSKNTNLFQSINSNTTVLTPNRRLSATLHKLYQAYQLELNHNCWETPDILPTSSWIQRLWHNYYSQSFEKLPLLLNTSQEALLWEQVLSQAKNYNQLLQLSETADLAQSAWNLIHQWQVDIHHSAFKSTDDYYALWNWMIEFQNKCTTENFLDLAQLAEHLIKKIQIKEIIPPQQIIVFGFTELSPQFKKLLHACEMNDSKVIQMEFSQQKTRCHKISFTDSEEEILTMARWAKQLIAKNKNAMIGCVIPSLDKIRDRVLQVFFEVFQVQHDYTLDLATCPFNISAGKSLLQYPIIQAALKLLSLQKQIINIDTFNFLLTTPFIGEAEIERLKRAQVDNLLRQSNVNKVNITSLITSETDKPISLLKSCNHLAKRLQNFYFILENNKTYLTYREWALFFNELLTTLGWPGERSLNSEEYQTVENWLKLLTEFMSLDQISPVVNFHQAWQTLSKMAARTIFQPQTPEAPIQVLGLLEAASLPFDYLWVAGMDDVSWPPQPRPHPLIPKSLQRELQMPHATAERELKFSEIITQQFKNSASELIFSFAEKKEDLTLQASAIIRNISDLTFSSLALEDYQTPSQRIFVTKNMEKIIDDNGPQVTTDKIRGGSNVIKQQALCPFKAFAEWRLYAQELETAQMGLRARERGTHLHKTLELIWSKLKHQETLNGLSDEELIKLIYNSVNEALQSLPPSQYISLEKKRLHKLIYEWLQIEKERPSFKVLANEVVCQINLNHLNLAIKIDRIDELADGEILIVDYKSGKNNEINNWLGDRPEEPQLPLYSLLDSEKTVAITLAQIATGSHCFKGISRYSMDIKGIKLVSEFKKATVQTWEELLSQWKNVLTKLSDDFYSGVAIVDPKEQQTCNWCALKPLCRINEEMILIPTDIVQSKEVTGQNDVN